MTPLVIRLSKVKLVLLTVGAAVFVVLGAWLSLVAGDIPRHDPARVRAIAVACMIFFAAAGAYGVRKLFDPAPGLVIDEEGLIDNSSGIAAGRIPWSEITGFRIAQIQRQRFLTIEVRDPEKYIRRASGPKRLLVAANSRYFGGPIHISANALDIGFDELVRRIREAHARHAGS